MERTDTERLTDERDDLLARIETLEEKIARAGMARRNRGLPPTYQENAMVDEIEASRLRLKEIEEELGWDDWREERRNSPIVL